MLGGLDEEFEAWHFAAFQNTGTTTYEHAMNWKIAIDTFGETYHFKMLHRDSLAISFATKISRMPLGSSRARIAARRNT
jgi:phenylpropionate dioxygenase-like ring-hydroxylating dioxygenase large terminal subunit